MSLEDDEFVARAGQLWAWIEDAISATAPVLLTAGYTLQTIGAPAWTILAAMLTIAGVVWVAIERRRDQMFPPEETP